MTWFKQKKNKYWYMVRREQGKEKYYYLGTEEDIINKIRGKEKTAKKDSSEKTLIELSSEN